MPSSPSHHLGVDRDIAFVAPIIKVAGEMGNSKVNGKVISLNVSDGISQADSKSLGKTILKQSQETQDSHFLRCVSDFY